MRQHSNMFYCYPFMFFLGFLVLSFNETFADTQNNLINKNFINQSTPSYNINPISLKGVLGNGIRSVTAGESHTCAINSENELYCWGRNNSGQLGDSTTKDKNIPTLILDNVNSVTAGSNHTCAINNENELYCWGANFFGQLGDNTYYSKKIPTLILNNVNSVTIGEHHTCAINSENELYCWGKNNRGQLGDGTTKDKNIPTLILNNVKSVTAIYSHTCAINSENELYCWGANVYGQLGDSTTKNKNIPTLILNDVNSVTVGEHHTCAINSKNELNCWGRNNRGQLGDDTTKDKNVPILILNNVTSVSAGYSHTCAINSKNELYCWGYNSYGQLGDNTNYGKNIPVFILDNVNSVTAGEHHTCAITSESKLYCWGANSYGQLGDGTNIYSRLIPVLISDDTVNDCSSDSRYSLIDSDCTTGVGACTTTGKYYCDTSDNRVKCDAVITDSCYEECNGVDDNKNGLIDEGFNIGDSCTVGVGICKRIGEYVCSGDNKLSICSEVAGEAGIESCDNLGTDDDCDGVIDNGVIFINNQCYIKSDIKNFEDCDPLDAVIVDNYCYKRSDYNNDDNELNDNTKPLPLVVTQITSQGKIEILMEKYKIGATLKRKLQKKVFKKYGVKKARLKVYYEYMITRIKGGRNAKIVKSTVKNKVVEKRMTAGNYKIRYRIIIYAIFNKRSVIIQTNKLSNAVRFTIVGK